MADTKDNRIDGLNNQIQDEFGATYSLDGKRLLRGPDVVSYEIREGTEHISDDAFFCHYKLTNVIIPDSVTSIGENVFHGCHNLNGLTIPSSVTAILAQAFRGCTGLVNFIIPNSIISIGFCSFSACRGLKSLVIPASVTSIGRGAFGKCSGLNSVIVSRDNPVYDSRKGCNAIIHTSTNSLLVGCKNTIIPEGITSIANDAFCESELTEINIPGSVTDIGDYAFSRSIELTKVTVHNSVRHIGTGAFHGCDSLNEIIVPVGSRDRFLDMLGPAYNTRIVEA